MKRRAPRGTSSGENAHEAGAEETGIARVEAGPVDGIPAIGARGDELRAFLHEAVEGPRVFGLSARDLVSQHHLGPFQSVELERWYRQNRDPSEGDDVESGLEIHGRRLSRYGPSSSRDAARQADCRRPSATGDRGGATRPGRAGATSSRFSIRTS